MAIRPRIHPDDPRRARKDRQKSGVNLMHEDPFYGFNVGRKIPARGSTDPSGVTFDGIPGGSLAVDGVGSAELDSRDGSRAVGGAHIQDQALADRHHPIRNVANVGNVPALTEGVKVDGTNIAAQAVSNGQIDDEIKGPGQGTFGLRAIGTLLGGGSVQAASSNHSHGSGNTHDFDYLPDTHQARILLARQRVRQNIRNLDTLTAAQFRLYIRELAIVALSALALEVDAPDLTAEERRAKRQAGESIPDFFEWRRSAELEAAGEEAPLHSHDLPRYQEGLPDVGTVPE
jgi:hypothetical protein